jgi:hypothetical protein
MISIQGTINIRTFTGRFGDFNVGTLQCSLGTFTVKDSTIDEFEQGAYAGTFFISAISPSSYFTSGRLVVEVRAKLEAIQLSDDAAPVIQEPLERDPLEDEVATPPHTASLGDAELNDPIPQPRQADLTELQAQTGSEAREDDPGQQLFGALWPLGASVKLDPTIDRALFRKQKEQLKAIGYVFQGSTQTWILSEGV